MPTPSVILSDHTNSLEGLAYEPYTWDSTTERSYEYETPWNRHSEVSRTRPNGLAEGEHTTSPPKSRFEELLRDVAGEHTKLEAAFFGLSIENRELRRQLEEKHAAGSSGCAVPPIQLPSPPSCGIFDVIPFSVDPLEEEEAPKQPPPTRGMALGRDPFNGDQFFHHPEPGWASTSPIATPVAIKTCPVDSCGVMDPPDMANVFRALMEKEAQPPVCEEVPRGNTPIEVQGGNGDHHVPSPPWREAELNEEKARVPEYDEEAWKKVRPKWSTIVKWIESQVEHEENMGRLDECWEGAMRELQARKKLAGVKSQPAFFDNSTSKARSSRASISSSSRTAAENGQNGCGLRAVRPSHPGRMFWDTIGILLLSHEMVMLPALAFDQRTSGLPDSYRAFWSAVDLFSTGFWTIDMFIGFFTGFHTSDGHVETRLGAVAQHYIKSYFLMDCPLVTIDWLNILIDLGGGTGLMRAGKALSKIARVLRLLRMIKMNSQMTTMLEMAVTSETILTMFGLAKIVVLIIVINHYIACGWYGLSVWTDNEWSWTRKHLDAQPDDTMGYAYATSLHWALTQFTPASMEVTPKNTTERLFNNLVIIIAMVAFSSFVSSITQAMTHLRQINARKSDQDARLRKYFAQNRITRNLSGRIWHFLRRHQISTASREHWEDIGAFKMLPARMVEELKEETYTPLLCVHPMLERLESHGFRDVIRKMCRYTITEHLLNTGDELFGDGYKVNSMMFVLTGHLSYQIEEDPWGKSTATGNEGGAIRESQATYSNNSRVSSRNAAPRYEIKVLAGRWACEASLWLAHCTLSGPLIASVGGCEYINLNSTSFREVAMKNRQALAYIAKYAQNFVREFNRAQEEESEDLLLSDQARIYEVEDKAWEEYVADFYTRSSNLVAS